MHNRTARIEIDEQGHLILPPQIMRRYGLVPGASLEIKTQENQISLLRSIASLNKIYLEPTNRCNLNCRTCMRNVWEEPPGNMTMETFACILQGLKQFSPPPMVFFGGFGEPLSHPNILDMIAAVKHEGSSVELITNGTQLSETVTRHMIEIGVDRVWVSIDGATPQSYADIRLGDELSQVIANLELFQDLRASQGSSMPKLGIAFVMVKRNIGDLPAVVQLGKRLGADQFIVSNLLPHTPDLRDEVLFLHSMYDSELQPSKWSPEIALPRMDFNEQAIRCFSDLLKGRNTLQIARQSLEWGTNRCPFLEKGSVSIRWDGMVSPCLPLMHTHTSYLAEKLRTSHAFAVGNIHNHSLGELWNHPDYVALRERLQDFDFSPCTFCNSCEMAESNIEDCFGNSLPACGGCLWAQGFIQCP